MEETKLDTLSAVGLEVETLEKAVEEKDEKVALVLKDPGIDVRVVGVLDSDDNECCVSETVVALLVSVEEKPVREETFDELDKETEEAEDFEELISELRLEVPLVVLD